ncbi:AN1-type zinc finger protein 2A isoform X2 [Perognathus longimembris pacificus]|uniref:AN1-type zinc finger protein 2A isoform X2 n=1 Tax=Perognathus longimembris pacificus TaxID=214514 RepID=UPI0020189936|nr:AN1-type zinc finger protein 2A isoform X2 [Perognathus longimembris pacificus]
MSLFIQEVPVKKGELPDVVVSEHMDRDCARRAAPGEKVFAHRCSWAGCRRKEMLQLPCTQCQHNFCIQHRHPLDHGCSPRGGSAGRAGCSATTAAECKRLASVDTPSSSWLAQRLRWKVKR